MRLRPRWVLTALGLIVLAAGGASIFSTPDKEVLFQTPAPLTTCTRAAGCISIYTLEVGNTGEEVQKTIRVTLRNGALTRAVLPPSVRNFGKVDRPVEVHDDAGLRVYELHEVRPGMRVQLQMTLRTDAPGSPLPWSDLLAGIESSGGRVARGDPASTSLGRMLYALFGRL